MTKKELDDIAYAIRTTKKKKGAGKGYKYFYEKVWSGRISRREYLERFAEIDRKGCGLFVCRLEFNDFTEDRWWDVPTSREEAIRAYREKIRSIRAKYGLSKSDVAVFMSV